MTISVVRGLRRRWSSGRRRSTVGLSSCGCYGVAEELAWALRILMRVPILCGALGLVVLAVVMMTRCVVGDRHGESEQDGIACSCMSRGLRDIKLRKPRGAQLKPQPQRPGANTWLCTSRLLSYLWIAGKRWLLGVALALQHWYQTGSEPGLSLRSGDGADPQDTKVGSYTARSGFALDRNSQCSDSAREDSLATRWGDGSQGSEPAEWTHFRRGCA